MAKNWFRAIDLVTSDWFARVFPYSIAFVASLRSARVPLDFGTVLVHTSWELKTLAGGEVMIEDFFLGGGTGKPRFLEIQLISLQGGAPVR